MIPVNLKHNFSRGFNKYMILDYCEKALNKAQYKKLNDGTWFAELHGFNGVWAKEIPLRLAESVLEEWLVLKRSRHGKVNSV